MMATCASACCLTLSDLYFNVSFLERHCPKFISTSQCLPIDNYGSYVTMVDIVTPNFVTAFSMLFELQWRRNYAQPTLKGHVIRAWRPDSYVSCVPKKWTKISLQFPFIQYLASSVLIRFMAAGLFIYVDGFDCKLVNYYLQSCYVRQKTTTLRRKQRQIFNKLKTTKKRFQGSVGRQSTLWSPQCSSTS